VSTGTTVALTGRVRTVSMPATTRTLADFSPGDVAFRVTRILQLSPGNTKVQ
jgi:hypothetical protein